MSSGPLCMVIRCQHITAKGRACNRFVLRLPFDAKVVRVGLQHSDESHESHIVAPCKTCGTLHEIKVA